MNLTAPTVQCISGSNPLDPFLLAPQIRLSFTIVHVEAVGKMRNCGMWNAEGKMRNGNCGKIMWNSG